MAIPMTTDVPDPCSVQSLLQLLQFSSPTLPVGGFAWSQGLETAIDKGWVNCQDSLMDWLQAVASHGFVYQEWPLLQRCHAAAAAGDDEALLHWNQTALAMRETAELYQQDTLMAAALLKLLRDLQVTAAQQWSASATSYVTAFALATVNKGVGLRDACVAFFWTWLENQLAVAIKAMPAGQTLAQQVFQALAPAVTDWLSASEQVTDENIGWTLPGVVMASVQHETQYSRLFRS